MGSYEDTRLWKTTLAPQSCDDPVHHEARERLRLAYIKLRERTQHLAGEIHRYLPDFTVHDVTHSDALWYTADLVIGSHITLTPAEAFVLGSSFLIHDLGMGLTAYVNGIDSIRKTPGWKGFVAKLARDEDLIAKFTEPPKERDFVLKPDPKKEHPNSLSQETLERAKRRIEEKAIEQLLRKSHAKQAAQLLTRSWEDRYSKTKTSYYLIEDSELRQTYAYLIGQIAYSHWWSISEIERVFHRPKAIGAVPPPWQYPRNWTVEPLIISCLLRVADICHIDASRAPLFLRSIRNPAEPSGTHWVFQGHIQQPYLSGDRLTYTSGQPFPPEHQQAWWLCFDTLKQIDKHLRETDSLLAHLERRRLAAHGVNGIEAPEFLAHYIQTSDWLPLDTKLEVTNIPHLVKNLGGEALYGDEPQIPLRELIQNASDAVRARRLVEGRAADWGTIYVRLGKDFNEEAGTEQDWIEVEDTGIGMSISVLTGPFIDFGTSYWGSALMLEEFPDALAEFHPTGKYGIGFFSVFMWGEHVTVTTRRYDDGAKDTHVLEFKKGLAPRPILRIARENERRNAGGTCIRVWLKTPPYQPEGLLDPAYLPKLVNRSGFIFNQKRIKTLYDLCLYLCPCLYVNLQVQGQLIERLPRDDKDQKQTKEFIKALVSRLSMRENDADKFLAMKIPGRIEDTTKFVDIMLIAKHPSQEDAGFACILPTEEAYTYTFLQNTIEIYRNKHTTLPSGNDDNTHIFRNIHAKNLPTFTWASTSARKFALVLALALSRSRGYFDINNPFSPRNSFHEMVLIAPHAFNKLLLTAKIISFCVLRFSKENHFYEERNNALKTEETLTREIQNFLIREIQEPLTKEFEKADTSAIFTPGNTILSQTIREAGLPKINSKMSALAWMYTDIEESQKSLDILDLLIMKIITILKEAYTIKILDPFQLSRKISNFFLHAEGDVLNNTEQLAKKLTETLKDNVYIPIEMCQLSNNVDKEVIFNHCALLIADYYITAKMDNNEEFPIFMKPTLEMFNISDFSFCLKNENIQNFILDLAKDVENKNIQNTLMYSVALNIIKQTGMEAHSERDYFYKTIAEYLWKIIKEFDSKIDKEGSFFENYYEFLKESKSYRESSYSIITTAGIRVAATPIRFIGSLEGEANKAARDSAFVDESALSNWSTEQAKEISGKSKDKVFLCAVAQMVRACGGDVGELPIAYTIDGWKTKMQISRDYAMVHSVKLISFWPNLETLEPSWELELQEHILIVNTNPPEKLLFRTKKTKTEYTLVHIVIEALAEGWKVPIEDLIKQVHELYETKRSNKQVEVEIGTKIHWDHTAGTQKSKPWYAPGYIITKPAESTS